MTILWEKHEQKWFMSHKTDHIVERKYQFS
jgi:hypothetical protein